MFIIALATGCSSGYGRLRHDDQVTKMFAEGRVPQDYTYYFNGRDHIPYAVIGISPDYRHESKFWDSVDPSSDAFRHMVDNIWEPFGEYETRGAYILDNQGNRIGIWLAKYSYAVIELRADNQVTVYSPYRPKRVGD